MKRFSGLDTLMASNAITSNTSFEAYYKQVLSAVESQGENFEGFAWAPQQIDFTYEMLEAEAQIEVMASYVDLNSPALPAGNSTKLTKLTGSIPRHKYTVVRGENDYRKQLILLNEIRSVANFNNTNESVAVSEYLAKALFDVTSAIPAAHKNTLNYQIGQMKSLGKLTLTDNNNPRGSLRTTFTAQVPTGNYMDKKWWESDTTAGTVTAVGDPIGDLRDFIRELRNKANGYQNVCVEMNEKTFYKLTKHDAVLTALGYAMTGIGLRYTKANDDNAKAVAKGSTLEAQKEAFKRLIEADEVIYNKTVCGVEKINTTNHNFDRTLVDAFEQDVILIRPTGLIGVIKNVVPLRPDGSAISAFMYGGRGLIEYLYNADTRTQEWRSELTALAVPTRPRDLYYFKNLTQEKAASGGD